MNDVLKLLGSRYNMEVRYSAPNDSYIVTVRDWAIKNAAEVTVPAIEVETGEVDILPWAVEHCICQINKSYLLKGENKK